MINENNKCNSIPKENNSPLISKNLNSKDDLLDSPNLVNHDIKSNKNKDNEKLENTFQIAKFTTLSPKNSKKLSKNEDKSIDVIVKRKKTD